MKIMEATTTGNSGKFRIPINLAPQIWDKKELAPFSAPVSQYIDPDNAYDSYDGSMNKSREEINQLEKKSKKLAKLGQRLFSQNDDEGNPLNGYSPVGSTESGTPKNITRNQIKESIRQILMEKEVDEDLAVWFGKKKKKKGSSQPQGPWVNICRKDKDGGHPPCGRDKSESKGYPKCRAKSVASKMSDAEKKSACQQKRREEKKNPKHGVGNTPTMVSHKKTNESLTEHDINRLVWKVLND